MRLANRSFNFIYQSRDVCNQRLQLLQPPHQSPNPVVNITIMLSNIRIYATPSPALPTAARRARS